MPIPTSAFSLAAYLALVVPGVVFVAVRVRLRGWVKADTHVGSRLLLAFVVSVVFDSFYVALFGPYVAARLELREAPLPLELFGWALAYLGLGLGIPALSAWLIYLPTGTAQRLFTHLSDKTGTNQFHSVPTAWDLGATTTKANWIRVRLAPGDYIGGYFSTASYFSTYPEARDLFIEEQWTLSEEGKFLEQVPGAAGTWLAIRDEYIVEWVSGPEEIDGQEQ